MRRRTGFGMCVRTDRTAAAPPVPPNDFMSRSRGRSSTVLSPVIRVVARAAFGLVAGELLLGGEVEMLDVEEVDVGEEAVRIAASLSPVSSLLVSGGDFALTDVKTLLAPLAAAAAAALLLATLAAEAAAAARTAAISSPAICLLVLHPFRSPLTRFDLATSRWAVSSPGLTSPKRRCPPPSIPGSSTIHEPLTRAAHVEVITTSPLSAAPSTDAICANTPLRASALSFWSASE
mmetsp:Transcript_1416/g.2154  ORF Transcript_1416/g.2154 Transcript_1416/m.2154 type:complete len:234 (-) Transcript_1416:1911-2612(-)